MLLHKVLINTYPEIPPDVWSTNHTQYNLCPLQPVHCLWCNALVQCYTWYNANKHDRICQRYVSLSGFLPSLMWSDHDVKPAGSGGGTALRLVFKKPRLTRRLKSKQLQSAMLPLPVWNWPDIWNTISPMKTLKWTVYSVNTCTVNESKQSILTA